MYKLWFKKYLSNSIIYNCHVFCETWPDLFSDLVRRSLLKRYFHVWLIADRRSRLCLYKLLCLEVEELNCKTTTLSSDKLHSSGNVCCFNHWNFMNLVLLVELPRPSDLDRPVAELCQGIPGIDKCDGSIERGQHWSACKLIRLQWMIEWQLSASGSCTRWENRSVPVSVPCRYDLSAMIFEWQAHPASK
jgi:hypothetical protein